VKGASISGNIDGSQDRHTQLGSAWPSDKHSPLRQAHRRPEAKRPDSRWRNVSRTARFPESPQTFLKIKLTSVLVNDQSRALKFYTEVLGFVKKKDIPVGQFSFLTVVSPDGPGEIELLLEPNDNPAAKIFQKALFEQRIPATVFFAENVQKEFERMKRLGVVFTTPPTKAEQSTFAVFDDTCGNLIRLEQG
jgi:predicted enzyme related to lactoylglutathione lyase